MKVGAMRCLCRKSSACLSLYRIRPVTLSLKFDLQVVREILPSQSSAVRINVDATRRGNVARFMNHRSCPSPATAATHDKKCTGGLGRNNGPIKYPVAPDRFGRKFGQCSF